MKYLCIALITILFIGTPWWVGLPVILLGTLFIPTYIPYWILLACGADMLFNATGGIPIYTASVGGMSAVYTILSSYIHFYEVV